ncbi:MAG: TerB family tellurite resistance protein [Cyclobacteriaceae bacterium]|nr:TerB family tellurite resistance protein [Cyclobacteriaceae bacterium]
MIGFFEHQYLSYKKKHVKNLLALANADGHLHDKEKALLFKIGEKYGLKERQVKSILDSKKGLELYIPESDDEKMDQLYDILLMVYADGIVDENEVNFCKDMVDKFGFKEALVDRLLYLFEKGDPPPEEWDNVKHELLEEYK